MATKLGSEATDQEDYLLHRGGYGNNLSRENSDYVIVTRLEDCESSYNAYKWCNDRTMLEAHRYINNHFDDLNTGDVVDVEFILGETSTPKISDRFN